MYRSTLDSFTIGAEWCVSVKRGDNPCHVLNIVSELLCDSFCGGQIVDGQSIFFAEEYMVERHDWRNLFSPMQIEVVC